MRTVNPVDLLRFVAILPLAIVLIALAIGVQSAPDSEIVLLSMDNLKTTGIVESTQLN